MTDRVGQQIGNYYLTRLIGEGGTAEVYLGQHTRVKELQVAVKILHEFVQDDKSLRDFRHEAAILARLKHPHITQLLDFGIQESMPFIVMTYAPHGNLEEKHPPGQRVPLDKILWYVKQIGEALQYAHEDGIVHCDLKPNNLLIGVDETLLVADFGFARLLQVTSRSLTSHRLGANFFYCAPEQFELQPPNAASDQYALGVIIYQWLCGKRPFNGTDPELLYQHLNEMPPPLCQVAPDLAPQIERVVLKALAKEPQQRFETIQQFVMAFAEIALPAVPVISAIEGGSSRNLLQTAPDLAIERDQETLPADVPLQSQGTVTQSSSTLSEQIDTPSYGCAITVLLGGLFLLGFMLFLCPVTDLQSIASAQEFLQQATVHVQGTVISIIKSTTTTTSGGTTTTSTDCDLTIGFQPVPGPGSHPTIMHESTQSCPSVGDRVHIVYRPRDPDNARTEDGAHATATAGIVVLLIAVIVSLVVVGIGVGLVYRARKM